MSKNHMLVTARRRLRRDLNIYKYRLPQPRLDSLVVCQVRAMVRLHCRLSPLLILLPIHNDTIPLSCVEVWAEWVLTPYPVLRIV